MGRIVFVTKLGVDKCNSYPLYPAVSDCKLHKIQR